MKRLSAQDQNNQLLTNVPTPQNDGDAVNKLYADNLTLSGSTPYEAEDAPHTSGVNGVPMLGIRQDADTSPVSADGDYHLPVFNSEGRLKVASHAGTVDPATGTLTAVGQTVQCDVSRASNVIVYVTGTFAGLNFTFEGSIDNGSSWFGIQAVRTNANTVETTSGVIGAAPAYAWEMSVNAQTHVRVRATAITSGTANIRILPGVYATEPVPAIQTHAVTGSGNFAVTMAAGATASPAKARDGAAGATDTGIPAFFVRRDTPTALTPVAGDYEIPQIDQHGATWVRQKSATTSAVSNVSSATTNATILAANAQRRGASIYNDSTAVLYLKLGATASATSFTIKMQPDSFYEVPFDYTGIIDGLWASANGAARVTEITS